MRLIDADRLLKAFCGHCEDYENCKTTCFDFRIIQTQPTVDAVPVVRCKDCRDRDPEDYKCDCGAMERQGCPFPVDDDYFCKYGARREWGDDHE